MTTQDNNPDTNFKVIDKRSPETRMKVAELQKTGVVETSSEWNQRTPDHIPDARKMVDPEMLHALKNAWATLSYMPCMCGYGFICGRCNTFNEIDALLKRVCGDDWYEREFEQYCKENPET